MYTHTMPPNTSLTVHYTHTYTVPPATALTVHFTLYTLIQYHVIHH